MLYYNGCKPGNQILGGRGMERLSVAKNRRHLETVGGKRVYLLGDTAWELFHRLDLAEAEAYLSARKEQGFNFIQGVVLAEFEGLTVPNAYGRFPLLKNAEGKYDPTLPDLSGDNNYFDHVENIVALAEKMGLYMGVLPTWGDKYNLKWGKGPEIFHKENAAVWGEFLARRLCRFENVVWILGGDRPLEEENHYAVNDGLAEGIRRGDGGKFLITFHPWGGHSSSEFVHSRPWLDFNMSQSSHGDPCRPEGYELIARDRALSPTKPTMDGEQRYEDHPRNSNPENGYFDAYDVRLAMYRNYLSGSCGNTYGHHSVWSMCKEPCAYFPNHWQVALHRPGAEQMRYFRRFVEEHDVSNLAPIENAVPDNGHTANYVAAAVGEQVAYLYIPCGICTELNPLAFPFTPTRVRVFEPTTGEYTEAATLEAGCIRFPHRGAGRGMDAVVILEP